MVSSGISNIMTGNVSSVRNIGNTGNPTDEFAKMLGGMTEETFANMDNQKSSTKMTTNFSGFGGKVNDIAESKIANSGNDKANKVKTSDNANKTKATTDSDKSSADKTSSTDKETSREEKIQSVKDKIKEEFEVTEEEIVQVLNNMGITIEDLLDETVLTDFVVELAGLESSIDLLVSEEMSMALSDIKDFINETLLTENDAEELFDVSDYLDVDLEEINNAQNQKNVIVADNVASDKEAIDDAPLEADGITDESNEVNDKIIDIRVTSEKESSADDTKSNQDGFFADNHSEKEHITDLKHIHAEFVNNLTEAVNETFETQGINGTVDTSNIINQIVENARITLNNQVTSMEMMLNPENLGKVNLNVSVKEGVVTATIVAQNEQVKEALESQIAVLKESFNSQSMKVEAVEVTVESRAFDMQNQHSGGFEPNHNGNNQQGDKERRALRLDSLDDLLSEDLSDEGKIVLDMMANEGNQVNFTA